VTAPKLSKAATPPFRRPRSPGSPFIVGTLLCSVWETRSAVVRRPLAASQDVVQPANAALGTWASPLGLNTAGSRQFDRNDRFRGHGIGDGS
jgi:hypothetical protein